MSSYNTVNVIAMHVEQFMRLRDYCITTGLLKFGYGEITPCYTTSTDPNSDYTIFQSIIGRLKMQYGHFVYIDGDMICYDQRRTADNVKTVSWVDM